MLILQVVYIKKVKFCFLGDLPIEKKGLSGI